MAPRKKPVLSCQFSCLRALEIASQNYIKNATKNLISNPEGGGGIKELELESSIKNVQKYLFHGMPKCLSSRITQSFLNSLQDWLLQQNMHHQDQQIELKDSIYIGLRLAEVIAHEHLEELDLSRVPKQIRSCLYGCMKKCPNLKSLHMGSGHGGWLSDSFCNRFYAPSLDQFTHLVTLRFQHDCTDHLLALVIQRNFPTLKIIDVSFSQNVSDASSEDLTMCSNLQELDLVGSGVTTKAVVFILSKCQKLVKVNAVKLAQVLEHLQPHQKVSLQECMPETDRCGFVTATTFKHLKRLSFHCPMITTLSIFSETNYAPLDWNNNGGGSQELENEGGHNIQLLHFQDIHFKYLTTLSTWGGTLKWNFLHQFGTQLTVLKLVHVEEITLESMRNILANTCPQLAKLELQNCALNDNSISSRNRKDKNEKTSSSSLKELTITSKCSERFVEKILTFCPALEVLELGTSVDLTDAVLEAVCIRSSSKFSLLAKLKTFKVGFSDKLTLRSVQFLLEYCPDICEISDLSSFNLVTKTEIQDLQESLSKSNSDVQLY